MFSMVLCLKAAIRSPYLYLMKFLFLIASIQISLVLSAQLRADDSVSKNQQLMQSLAITVPDYQPTPLKDLIIAKQMKRQYEVTWRARPDLSFVDANNTQLKASVKIKMTVVAKTGYIVDVHFIQSSNSKKVDEKIKQALLVASLEPISGLAADVVYDIEHTLLLK